MAEAAQLWAAQLRVEGRSCPKAKRGQSAGDVRRGQGAPPMYVVASTEAAALSWCSTVLMTPASASASAMPGTAR